MEPEAEKQLLLRILSELDRTPAPHGRERLAAVRLRAWCAQQWNAVDWEVLPHGESGASLIGRFGAAPESVLLYSHLDTSLDGTQGGEVNPDTPVTGRTDPAGPLRVHPDGRVDGFGLGVARGPAAAALLAFVKAAQADPDDASPLNRRPGATLLLAGSGTHRLLPGETTGVEAYLVNHPRPGQVVVAKAGPPGVLHSEPGAAYLGVRIRARQGAVLARRFHQPEGGIIVHVGKIIDAIESWRLHHLAVRPDVGQLGAEVGIGHIASGLPTKPDLIPAVLDIGLYLVTLPGDDVSKAASDLEEALRVVVPERCTVAVSHRDLHPAGLTDEAAPIVIRAHRAREKYLGPGQRITGWTGSTDGVVFRGRAIDTVRLGPTITPSTTDPRRDETTAETLVTWSRIYADLLA